MTTFLFYQTIALFGHAAGSYYAELETDGGFILRKTQKMFDLLGGIEVWQKMEDQKFKKVDVVWEMGPIATDQHLIKLEPVNSNRVEIELRMTKGLWRLNQVNLGHIDKQVYPRELSPFGVKKEGELDEKALSDLNSEDQYLISMPGDEYNIYYKLPEDRKIVDLFVKSQGYYIEWLREDWFKDQDLAKIQMMYVFPRKFFTEMAPWYKNIENEMETIFWNSHYVR